MGNQQLTCQDCGQSFEFTAEEQQFFADKGFQPPKRCSNCRRQKKDNRRGSFTTVNCSECGVETQVPFVPKGDRPVYCRNCFETKGGKSAGGGDRGGRGGAGDMNVAA